MLLRGHQLKQVQHAFLTAFLSAADMRQFVRFELDEELDHIYDGTNMRDRVFELIRWADSRGRIDDLIRGALNHNPGNEQLNELVREQWVQQLYVRENFLTFGTKTLDENGRTPPADGNPEPTQGDGKALHRDFRSQATERVHIEASWWGTNLEDDQASPRLAYNNLRIYCVWPGQTAHVRTIKSKRLVTIDLREGILVTEVRTSGVVEFSAPWPRNVQTTVIERPDVNWVFTRYSPFEEVRFDSYALHHVAITFDYMYVKAATLVKRAYTGNLKTLQDDYYLLVVGEKEVAP